MHNFACENFLVPCDPNQAGFRQWRNYLRQWYLHGPVSWPEKVRTLAQEGKWDQVVDYEAVANENNLQPNLQPASDPTKLVERGVWMRWEAYTWRTHWYHPERVIARNVHHEWYIPRTENYPQWNLPPAGMHLPLEQFTKDDILMPVWEKGVIGTYPAYCPRCETKFEGQPSHCPSCRQKLGDYNSYSSKGWPRKAWSLANPPMPDDYSFYFLAAWVHAPETMTRMDLLIGSSCRYKAWLNGQEVGRYVGPQRYCHWDQDCLANMKLRSGWNLVLLKLAHETALIDYGIFMVARLALPDKRVVLVNDFANENPAPEEQLKVTVSEPVPIGVGFDYPLFRRFSDGTLVCNNRLSRDDGKTWEDCPMFQFHQPNETWEDAEPADLKTWDRIQDPTTLILHERGVPVEPGVYKGRLCRSIDGWRTRQVLETTITIPEGADLVGESNLPLGAGIIMGLNIIGLDNGDLLAPMYGGLKSDVVWFDDRRFGGYLKYPQEWPNQYKYRSWVIRSQDGGKTWHYLSTIAAFPELGDEGFAEPGIVRLANGTLLAVLRNGGGPDRPFWVCRSTDGGQSWSCPIRTTVTGNYPSLVAMSNGVLACIFGRPDNRVGFDLTQTGLAWSHSIVLYNGPGNEHVEGTEIAPGELYCVYEDNEYDCSGNRLTNGTRQWYGVRVKAEKLTK